MLQSNYVTLLIRNLSSKTTQSYRYALNDNIVIEIGRTPEPTNKIVLNHKAISRRHATVSIENGKVYITDTQSANGVYINQQIIAPNHAKRLMHNDHISFGQEPPFVLEISYENHNAVPAVSPSTGRTKNETIVSTDTGYKGSTNVTDVSKLFLQKNILTIGRSDDNDIPIPSVMVSRKHATIEKHSEVQYCVTDLGSTNGTFINGKLLEKGKSLIIGTKDELRIGPMVFRFDEVLMSTVMAYEAGKVVIKAYNLWQHYGATPTFENAKLKTATFDIKQGEFVAVMGPSGCGKSTLLKALNGVYPASIGNVKIFGHDLIKSYPYLKTHIGYVPQDDIVHKDLTVYRTLFYAAKLRLPKDVSQTEIDQKINSVLKNLNLNPEQVKKQLVGKLSGGQRKRISIAVELLTEPKILFLDEPTSPLDPETIDDFLDCLKKLKDTTIVMVTHKPSDLNYVDKVVFLGKGGYLTYYGSPKNLKQYFGEQSLNKVYSKNSKETSAKKYAEKWLEKNNVQKEKNVINKEELVHSRTDSFWRQFYWLSRRYLNIKLNDTNNMTILLGQAPAIVAVMLIVFGELTLGVLFLIAICAIWFGTSNAAKEIVSELAIYKRERMFNLNILPYILSKISVLSIFSLLQSLVFVLLLYIRFNFLQGEDYGEAKINFWASFFIMSFLCFSGTIMGLLLSAFFTNVEKVMTFLPLVLIPQIILSGVVAPINPHNKPVGKVVEYLSYTQFVRWGGRYANRCNRQLI